MRAPYKDDTTGVTTPGETIMYDLVRALIVLIPMAIDPHGKWGPLMDIFLFGYGGRKPINIPATHPHAAQMLKRATTAPCPSGIITTASVKWKQARTRRFYGHSHTAPTPYEHTVQQLGLVVTRAYALHLRNSTRKMGKHPKPSKGRTRRRTNPTTQPPGAQAPVPLST